jgi:hypothetical protein
MSHRLASSLFLGAFLLSAAPLPLGQAPGGSSQKSAKAAKDTSSAKKIDVCALLTSAEIEAAQGEPVQEIKPSSQPSGGLLMSQCLFRTATFAKSVSLALATPDPDKRPVLTPREFWRKQFHPPEQEKGEEEKPAVGKAPKNPEAEREKEGRKLRPVNGLGEEAYWVGNQITGAVYVLKGEAFLRISVGGVRDESSRMEKSKTLARAALRRL